MGYSIGRVFKPIEEEMKKYAKVDSIYMPVSKYSLRGLWKNILAARKAVKQKHYDIVHVTGAEHYLIPFLKGQKVVVTVHDLGFYTNHSKTIKQYWKALLFIKTLKWADCVTFISEKSQSEAMQLVKINRKAVIPDPVGYDYVYHPKSLNALKPIVLQIGTKDNKNLLRTIAALKGINCHLRIIGNLSNQQVDALENFHLDYSNACNLTDEQIIEEYKNCDIVSLPSVYEGFGMPIIEGQSVGRVVVTSNISPMKEIAGDSAVLVDPYDINSIRVGFIKAINQYESFVRKGLKNVNSYRINVIANRYYTVYKNITL